MEINIHAAIRDRITEVSTDTFTVGKEKRIVKTLRICIDNKDEFTIFFSGDKDLDPLVNEFKKVIES